MSVGRFSLVGLACLLTKALPVQKLRQTTSLTRRVSAAEQVTAAGQAGGHGDAVALMKLRRRDQLAAAVRGQDDGARTLAASSRSRPMVHRLPTTCRCDVAGR